MMREAYICDAIRTPVGKYAGALASIRPDDLAALPMKALRERNPGVDWDQLNDVLIGCANQAGEDNRNIARMALLLAGFSHTIAGATINRLCGSGMDAAGSAARAIKASEADLIIAGGVESMSRAPFVMGKPEKAYDRAPELFDTTIGWRFVNPVLDRLYGTDSMIQTAENLARQFGISRSDQDLFALHSQEKARRAQQNGSLSRELVPVTFTGRKGETSIVDQDEHPRLTSLDKLLALQPILGVGSTITAGNASGVNDGAAALLIASEQAVQQFSLQPVARLLGMEVAGVEPRIMGIGPVPATLKLLKRLKLNLSQIDLIELNEAFAAQALACIRELGLSDDDPRINPLGGAIALGHPLGMSGARLLTTAWHQMKHSGAKRALCTMCIGVGQGIATVIERV